VAYFAILINEPQAHQRLPKRHKDTEILKEGKFAKIKLQISNPKFSFCNLQFDAFMSLRLTLHPCVGGSAQAKKNCCFALQKNAKIQPRSCIEFQ